MGTRQCRSRGAVMRFWRPRKKKTTKDAVTQTVICEPAQTTPQARNTGLTWEERQILTNAYRAKVLANAAHHRTLNACDYTRDEKIAMTRAACQIDYDAERLRQQVVGSTDVHPLRLHRTNIELSRLRSQRSSFNPNRRSKIGKQHRQTHVTHKPRRSKSVIDKAKVALKHVTTCAYCGCVPAVEFDDRGSVWHIDHVIPISKNGKDDLSNMVKACRDCNLSKSNHLWIPRRGTPYADGHTESREGGAMVKWRRTYATTSVE
jgi:5-methylcytosine-specific restriction endonuclease McrA